MADITPRKTAKGTKYEARWPNPEKPGKYRTKLFDKHKQAADHLKNLTRFTEDEAEKKKVAASPTIGKALDTWLGVAGATGVDGNDPVDRSTLRHYKTEANHIRGLWLDPINEKEERRKVSDVQLGELDTPLVMRIRAAALAQLPTRKTAQRAFSRLRFALNEARRQGTMSTNPADGVSIKIGSRLKEPPGIPEEYEVEAIFRAAESGGLHDGEMLADPWRTSVHLICRILACAGLRPSELRGLARKSIRTDFPMIEVLQRADEFGTIGVPKTKAGRRVVRIQEDLWQDILAWLETMPADPDALLFCTDSGKAQSHSNMYNRMWLPLQVAAGILDKDDKPKYILYALRHFYASTEIAMGANPKELQEAMGHEDITTTMNIYGHLFKMRDGGGQAARAEMRAKRLAGDRPDEKEAKVVTFKRAS